MLAAVQAETSQEEFAACLEWHFKSDKVLGPTFVGKYEKVKINERDCKEALKIFYEQFFVNLRKKVAADPLLADKVECVVSQAKEQRLFTYTMLLTAYMQAEKLNEPSKVRLHGQALRKQTNNVYSFCSNLPNSAGTK